MIEAESADTRVVSGRRYQWEIHPNGARTLTSGVSKSIKRWPRVFAPRLFQAPPRGECYFTLALRYHFTSITL